MSLTTPFSSKNDGSLTGSTPSLSFALLTIFWLLLFWEFLEREGMEIGANWGLIRGEEEEEDKLREWH